MKRFKSAGHAQRFLSAHDQVANFFRSSANDSVANNLFHSFRYGGCGHSSGDRDVQGQAF